MNYGFYQSATGLMTQVHRLQVATNNLANSETNGFKADELVTSQRLPARIEGGYATDPQWLLEQLGGGQLADPTRFVMAQGSLSPTDGELDLAIDGDAFFVVGDARGDASSIRLTRDGRFTRDPEGELAMLGTGMKVLDSRNRTIAVPPGAISVGADGLVTQAGEELGRVGMVNVENTDALRKVGDSLIMPTPEAGKLTTGSNSTIWQGYLESSTVEPVIEMAGIVQIGRAVEANAKLMQAQDLLAGQAINTFGKVT
ncbi:MAG: flagellar hook-basal body protein [Phycisphaerales bacterium]|nr:flagellar hook-basal body protein [Phycisphaerales bacterium]